MPNVNTQQLRETRVLWFEFRKTSVAETEGVKVDEIPISALAGRPGGV